MSVYYTGKGDDGISHIGLKKIAKTDFVMTALGDLDELNSVLGVVKHRLGARNKKRFQKLLNDIQENIFIIQAHIAAGMFEKLYQPPPFKKDKIINVEHEIALLEKKLNPIQKFIVAGANEEAAWLDFARTIARRAERSVLLFSKQQKINPEVFAYLNRLSSLLFVMARVAGNKEKERSPKYN